MKKAVFAFTILAVVMIVILNSYFMRKVEAVSFENADFYIENVDHRIEVMYNGYVFINNTIRIVGNASDEMQPLERFLIGFPYKYGEYVLRCMAYDASKIFDVKLNVPLENRMGFYAVEISFPQPLDISSGTNHSFNVGFVLSNSLLNVSDTNLYTLDFPAYPSLTRAVDNCNVTIILPEGAADIVVEKDDGSVNSSTYVKQNLPPFTHSPANVNFSLTGDKLQRVDITELKSEIRINEMNEIEASDSYYITSKTSAEISAFEVILLPNASNPRAQDQLGRKMQDPVLVDEKTNRYRVTFMLPLEGYKSARFTVKYCLSSQVYINAQEGVNNFQITFPLFQNFNCYIEHATITFFFPEGARILSLEDITLFGYTYVVTRSVFQEIVTINKQGISYLENVPPSEKILQILYGYNPLWLSFRPTLWVWAVATLGFAIVVVWRRPKAPVQVAVPTVAVRLRPEYIKSFVDTYEEKRKIILEVESLETMVRKGKIPRRRYKVRRRTLETRLNTLSRSLAEFMGKMRAVGGLYAELMRQLEIAETEINEVEANIKSIEARYSRGEISLEAYRKLLADYQSRRERAKTTINGILIRLREEIR